LLLENNYDGQRLSYSCLDLNYGFWYCSCYFISLCVFMGGLYAVAVCSGINALFLLSTVIVYDINSNFFIQYFHKIYKVPVMLSVLFKFCISQFYILVKVVLIEFSLCLYEFIGCLSFHVKSSAKFQN